jgi:hypothetical protein
MGRPTRRSKPHSRIDVLKYASGRGDSIVRPPVKSRFHLDTHSNYEAAKRVSHK